MNKEISNQYLEATLHLKNQVEGKFLELGQRLMRIRDEELYLSTHSSFVEFLWEMKLTESTASKMISIYSKYIVELGIDPVKVVLAGGWTTAYKLKDLATDKEGAEKVLQLAATWSPKDLDSYITERKTGKPQDDCEHTFLEFKFCTKCHLKEKLYNEE